MAYVDLGNAKLELMEPVGALRLLRGEPNPSGGIHHICVETKDAVEAIGCRHRSSRPWDGTAKPAIMEKAFSVKYAGRPNGNRRNCE